MSKTLTVSVVSAVTYASVIWPVSSATLDSKTIGFNASGYGVSVSWSIDQNNNSVTLNNNITVLGFNDNETHDFSHGGCHDMSAHFQLAPPLVTGWLIACSSGLLCMPSKVGTLNFSEVFRVDFGVGGHHVEGAVTGGRDPAGRTEYEETRTQGYP